MLGPLVTDLIPRSSNAFAYAGIDLDGYFALPPKRSGVPARALA